MLEKIGYSTFSTFRLVTEHHIKQKTKKERFGNG